MRFSDICGKQVINVRDGTMIGCVNDVVFNPMSYVIDAIYVRPQLSKVKRILPWFFPCDEIEISVNEIENIMGDVILVKVH